LEKGGTQDHLRVTLFERDLEDAARILKRILLAGKRRPIVEGARGIDPVASAADTDDRHESLARQLFAVREARLRWLPDSVSAEAAWDLLIALYLAKRAGARHTIGGMIELSRCSHATALRHIQLLVQAGLASRESDKNDRRVFYLLLSEKGRELLEKILSEASA
jgi:hypothetical protein